MLADETEDSAEGKVVDTISIVADDDGRVEHVFVELSVFNTKLEEVEVSFSSEENVSEEFDADSNEVDKAVPKEV